METLNLVYNAVIPRDIHDLDQEAFIDLSFFLLFRLPVTESVETEYAEDCRQVEAQEFDVVGNDQLVYKPGKKKYSFYKLRYACPFPP